MNVGPRIIAFCCAKQMSLGLGSLQSRSFFSVPRVRLKQLVRLALLAAGKRGVAHPRLHFGEQISEAKYACAHRDAETARAEKLFVMRLHELVETSTVPAG